MQDPWVTVVVGCPGGELGAPACQTHLIIRLDVWEPVGAKMIGDDLTFLVVYPMIWVTSAAPGKCSMGLLLGQVI